MNDQNQNYINGLVMQNAKLKDDVKSLRKALYDLLPDAMEGEAKEQAEQALRDTKGFQHERQ